MKEILILGAGLMQKPAIESAKELNCRVTVVDGNPNALCHSLADDFYTIDLKDIDALLVLAKKMKQERGLDAVFTAGTDFSANVARIAQEFNLPGHSYEAACNASDKIRMRQCFLSSDVPSPAFYQVTKEDLQNTKTAKEIIEKAKSSSILFKDSSFPYVVKPCDNMGARGCRMVQDEKELIPALQDAVRYSRTSRAILEEYMDGPEFSIDSLVYNDTLTITGFADRHIFYPPYFIEMGHTMPTNISKEDYDSLVETFTKGIKALGLTLGAAKGDIKLTKKGPMIGEIAARLSGGYMSGWTYPYASDINLTKEALKLALGMQPSALLNGKSIDCNKTSAERAWVSIPGIISSVTGLDEAAKIPNVMNVFPRSMQDDSVSFPVNNVEKCGNIISVASTREEAITACEEAIRKINIRLQINNPNTDAFLSMPLDTDFPPSAFLIPQEQKENVDKWFIEHKSDVFSVTEDNRTILSSFQSIFKIADQKDWNGKTISCTLEEFFSIYKNTEINNISLVEFCKNLLRGGIQGIVYFVDSLLQKEF